jgi:hypothetical protein
VRDAVLLALAYLLDKKQLDACAQEMAGDAA